MSEELETSMKDHTLTKIWGGADKGVCVQVTAKEMKFGESVIDQLQNEGWIKLTMEEASALCNDLMKFIKEEAERRRALLKKQIHGLQVYEKTVFEEIANLNIGEFMAASTVVDMVSAYCPKHEAMK